MIESSICKIDKSKLSGFRNRLSTYLKELGLQKKRYNDGYYYYGIIDKCAINENLDMTMKQLLEKRSQMCIDMTNIDFYTNNFVTPEYKY